MPPSPAGRCYHCQTPIHARVCPGCKRVVVVHDGLPVLMTEASEGEEHTEPLSVGWGRWSPAELADELVKAAS